MMTKRNYFANSKSLRDPNRPSYALLRKQRIGLLDDIRAAMLCLEDNRPNAAYNRLRKAICDVEGDHKAEGVQ